MPDTKISALSDAGALTGTEIVPLANGGANERTTTQAIADLAAGGGALTLIGTLEASASATLDFTGLSGTSWKLVGRLLIPASDAGSYLRFGTGAGPTYVTAGYNFGGVYSLITGAPTATAERTTNVSEWRLVSTVDNTSPGLSFDAMISTDNATYVTIVGTAVFKIADGNHYQIAFGGTVPMSAPLTALRFYQSTGNVASGKLSLYAVDD